MTLAEVVYKTIFQFKRGTSEKWTELNPILRQGEPGFEIDTGKLKIGDGSTEWKQLKYINSSLVNVDVDNQSIVIDGIGQISLKGFTEASTGQSIRKREDGTLEWYTPISQDKVIETISIGNKDLPVEDNKVTIPAGTEENLGLIKGSSQNNQIKILSDGTGEINSVGLDKIVDVKGFTLILNCGTAVD